MSVSTFAAPIEAESLIDGLPVLILATQSSGYGFNSLLVVDGDGGLQAIAVDQVRLNWRYDWREHSWKEVGEIHESEDNAADGSEDLSGPVPELDTDREGDSFDQEGRQATGNPGDLDAREEE